MTNKDCTKNPPACYLKCSTASNLNKVIKKYGCYVDIEKMGEKCGCYTEDSPIKTGGPVKPGEVSGSIRYIYCIYFNDKKDSCFSGLEEKVEPEE